MYLYVHRGAEISLSHGTVVSLDAGRAANMANIYEEGEGVEGLEKFVSQISFRSKETR